MYMKPVSASRIPYVVKRAMPAGATYMGEDAQYYYWMNPQATDQLGGMFDNIGNMFTRMVKFTPKSFTPGNIYKGFINTTLTVASGGLYQVLPKGFKKTVYEVGKVAVPVIAGGVLAYTAGPAVWGVLAPKLAQAGNLLKSGAGSVMQMVTGGRKGAPGGGETYGPPAPGESGGGPGILETASQTIQVGGQLMALLGKLPQNKQAEVAQMLTPEQIAYMERTGSIPPELRNYFDQMAQSTFNPQAATTGAAGLYNPFQAAPEPVAEAGMFGWMNPMMLAAFGLPVLFYMMSGKK